MPPGGYILLSRKFFESWLWTEAREFSRAEAFQDLVMSAAWGPYCRAVNGSLISLERGEVVASLRFLAERWAWSVKRVRVFLAQLEKKGTARAQRETPAGHVYLLVNYDAYQSNGHSGGTEEDGERAQRGHSEGTARAQRKYSQTSKSNQSKENQEGTLFESSAPPPSASAAPPGDPVEVWIPFEGTQPPSTAKHGPWRAGTNGAHWEYGVTASLLANLRSLYPGVEVDNQVRQFADWCHRNPEKRKTYGKRCGVLESLHFWLQKRQNGGGTNGNGNLGAFGVTAGVLLAERRNLGRSPELDAEIEEDRKRLMANRAEEDARRAAVS